MDAQNQKPVILYPTSWEYKVIGADKALLELAIESIFTQRDYSISPSRQSSRGTFTSLTIRLRVESEEDRISLYNKLCQHSSIKMVL